MYEDLRHAIELGVLDAEELLGEEQLAADFGVSRTPAREALLRLESDGLVARTQRGYHVRSYTFEEIADIYEARILLESQAAGQAANRHTEADALRLCRLAAAMCDPEAPVESREQRLARNRDFHLAIWEAARNRIVLEVLTRLHRHSVRHTTLGDDARWNGARHEHARLLDAIIARDGAQASVLMAEHIANGRDLFLTGKVQDALPELWTGRGRIAE